MTPHELVPTSGTRSMNQALVLIRHSRQDLAEARTAVEFRQVIAVARTAEEIAHQQERLAGSDETAREAAGLAIEAQALRLDAEAAAGDWLKAMAESRERFTRRNVKSQAATSQSLADLGVSKSESSRWQQVSDVPTTVRTKYVDTVRKTGGDVSRARLLRLAREADAERRRQEPVPATPLASGIDIRHGDFMDVLDDIESGSVDAIITDPPYPREFIPLYGRLASFAARALKPSGVLAVMCGQSHVRAYLHLLDEHLAYRWIGAYITQGPRTRIHQARVGTGWKPVLLYERKDADGVAFLLDDLFESRGDDKKFHHWGQSESGIAVLVERLTQPGHIVIDPFLGGGTTAIVCRDLGREFVGCDVDAAAISSTMERLAA